MMCFRTGDLSIYSVIMIMNLPLSNASSFAGRARPHRLHLSSHKDWQVRTSHLLWLPLRSIISHLRERQPALTLAVKPSALHPAALINDAADIVCFLASAMSKRTWSCPLYPHP